MDCTEKGQGGDRLNSLAACNNATVTDKTDKLMYWISILLLP